MSGSIDLATIRQLLQALHPLVAPAAQPASLSMGAAVRQNLEPNSDEANEILNSTWHQQLASQRPWTPGADPKMAIPTEPRGSLWLQDNENGYVPQYTPPSKNAPPATNDTLEIHGGKHGGLGQALMHEPDPQNVADQRQMPVTGPLPGRLFINDQIAPKVPNGAPRPFAPGEYVENPNGSWSSEITGTIEAGDHPELNGGRATIVPTLWLVNGKPVRVDEDTAAAYAVQSGLSFPAFPTNDAAEAFSQQREDLWQNLTPGTAGQVPALWAPAAPSPVAAPVAPQQGLTRVAPPVSYAPATAAPPAPVKPPGMP